MNNEQLLLQKSVSFLMIFGILLPVLIVPPVLWIMGASELSLVASIGLALSLAFIASPVAVFARRTFRRPLLVLAPGALQEWHGRRLVAELPRADILSIDVRESAATRSAVAHMRSGDSFPLVLPRDLRLPLLGDPRFEQRMAVLEGWREDAGHAD